MRKPPSCLFVYGTLRRGATADLGQQCPSLVRWLTRGHCGGQLFLISHYPGMVLAEQSVHTVWGDVYELLSPETLLPRLDDYEECSARFDDPKEYIRQVIHVNLPDGSTLPCWAYLYNRPTAHLPIIPSGDFLANASPQLLHRKSNI